MTYRFSQSVWQQVFCVPFTVVERCLPGASGDAVKVLLAILGSMEPQLTTAQIARMAGVSEPAADAAAAYWVREGILSGEAAPGAPDQALPPAEPATPQEHPVSPARRTQVSAPQLSAKEIRQMMRKDEEIAFLLQSAESLYGRPVSSTEQRGLVSMREWIGLPVDVILMVVKYCLSNGKDSIRYIEKTAAAWADEGICTHEAAEEYLKQKTSRNKIQNQIRSLFGIGNRSLTSNEKKYMERWIEEFGYGPEMVGLAYEIAVNRTGNLSFPYINKILESWHQKGYRTPEEAGQENNSRSQRYGKGPAKQKGSFDISEFEEMGVFEIPDVKKE